MNIETTLRHALISTGRISPMDRIEISEKYIGSGDYARIGLYVYHGRMRKPFAYWNLCVDTVRNTVHWDTSTFYYI